MTPRELAVLRDKVNRVRAGLPVSPTRADVLREMWRDDKRKWRRNQWRRKRGVWCVYCGDRIKDQRGRFSKGLTCRKHIDLPDLDPRYGGGLA